MPAVRWGDVDGLAGRPADPCPLDRGSQTGGRACYCWADSQAGTARVDDLGPAHPRHRLGRLVGRVGPYEQPVDRCSLATGSCHLHRSMSSWPSSRVAVSVRPSRPSLVVQSAVLAGPECRASRPDRRPGSATLDKLHEPQPPPSMARWTNFVLVRPIDPLLVLARLSTVRVDVREPQQRSRTIIT